MCPPERLRDDRLTLGQPPSSHIDNSAAFAGPPSTMKRRISDTFLAVRDFAVTVLEARAEREFPDADPQTDEVSHR
jgi:hypothetical protein